MANLLTLLIAADRSGVLFVHAIEANRDAHHGGDLPTGTGRRARRRRDSLSRHTSAQLTYTRTNLGFANTRETVSRNGIAFFDQFAGTSGVCPDCPPGPAFAGRASSVSVLQLDSTADPEVVFDLYTGGAHCCYYSQILRFVPGANAYSPITHDWLDPFYRFEDLTGDGLPEFVSADGRFAYVFGSFASTRFPPQIWRYESGVLLDITRQFPVRIAADAAGLKRQYKRNPDRRDVRQVLLTFTADQCLLGSCGTGLRLARKAVAAGNVERGGRFLRALRRFLRNTGYLV